MESKEHFFHDGAIVIQVMEFPEIFVGFCQTEPMQEVHVVLSGPQADALQVGIVVNFPQLLDATLAIPRVEVCEFSPFCGLGLELSNFPRIRCETIERE